MLYLYTTNKLCLLYKLTLLVSKVSNLLNISKIIMDFLKLTSQQKRLRIETLYDDYNKRVKKLKPNETKRMIREELAVKYRIDGGERVVEQNIIRERKKRSQKSLNTK